MCSRFKPGYVASNTYALLYFLEWNESVFLVDKAITLLGIHVNCIHRRSWNGQPFTIEVELRNRKEAVPNSFVQSVVKCGDDCGENNGHALMFEKGLVLKPNEKYRLIMKYSRQD